MLLSHFATGRQISFAGDLISYAFSAGTKGCDTAADLIDSDKNLHCFTQPLSSCDIKISVVSQCRSTALAFQYINTQPLGFFLTD